MRKNHLTFSASQLRALAVKHEVLWLVGDEGVYFMGADSTEEIIYAEECNPERLPFDEWWAVKQATWGGDDGVVEVLSTELTKGWEKLSKEDIVRVGFDGNQITLELWQVDEKSQTD